MTEDQLEQEALGWLADVGYTVAHGPELAPDGKAPERASYRQVLLVDRLRRAIRSLNPDIPQAAREDAITQLLNLGEPQLLQANRRFHRLLVGGVPVQHQKGEETRGDFVRLVDWAQPGRNEWLASARGKGGVVWHTQGSGKSISMTCFAARVMQEPLMENPTIVVITDRNDLDGQLFGVFSLSQDLLREQPVQAATCQELRKLLSTRPSGGIVFTTIQKFMPGEDENAFPVLSDRRNIVGIADEAHRAQYGFEARLKTVKQRPAVTVLSTGSGELPATRVEFAPSVDRYQVARYQVGCAQHLRDALPNATFVAFTGTPVSSQERDTRAVFGDYISVYDMQQAKEDGATVAICYESRLAQLGLKAEELAAADEEVEELAED